MKKQIVFNLVGLLLCFCGGCTTVTHKITSEPSGAKIYAGPSPSQIADTGLVTPIEETLVGEYLFEWYYILRKSGYEDSPVLFAPSIGVYREIKVYLKPKSSKNNLNELLKVAREQHKGTEIILFEDAVTITDQFHVGDLIRIEDGKEVMLILVVENNAIEVLRGYADTTFESFTNSIGKTVTVVGSIADDNTNKLAYPNEVNHADKKFVYNCLIPNFDKSGYISYARRNYNGSIYGYQPTYSPTARQADINAAVTLMGVSQLLRGDFDPRPYRQPGFQPSYIPPTPSSYYNHDNYWQEERAFQEYQQELRNSDLYKYKR